MNQKISRNSRLITIFPQNFWVKPRIGLAWMPDYYIEMKQKEKSAYINFRTDVESSRYRHIQLVEKDERLISFNYLKKKTENFRSKRNYLIGKTS